uniref:Uncharacterized protein n=1 Tax=Desertifilum tharense IPPAS B-1220 TaxID=1781255 RepID=A0ACD5GZ12_9CYAN
MKHANLVRMFLFATASALALGANFVPLSTAQEQPQPQPQPTVQPSPTPQPPQRTVFLLSNPCVSAGTGRTIRERQDISVVPTVLYFGYEYGVLVFGLSRFCDLSD